MRFIRLKYLFSLLSLISSCAFADLTLNAKINGINNPIAASNAQVRMAQTLQDLPQPLAPSQAESFYQYSDAIVAEGIAPFGYFQPSIGKQLKQNKAQWQIDYEVKQGQKTRIIADEIKLAGEGRNEIPLRQQVQQSPFKKGDFFLSTVYEHYKTQLLDAANDLGYINARFTQHEVLVDRKQAQAVIHLVLDTGPRYYFGLVHFSQNPLNDHFLNRFVPFKTGQVYSSDQVNELQKDLKNSSYFSRVSVAPDLTALGDGHEVPIHVQLKPVPRQQYILGLGYGTDTGPRATLGSDWHYVNSYGHRFNTLLRLSQVQSTASAKYIIPGAHPLSDEYNINASVQTNNINQGNSVVKQLGGGYTYSHQHWQYTFSLSEQIERYNFFSGPYQTSHLFLPSFGLQHLSSNDPLAPTDGNRFNASIKVAKQGILSDTSMVQTTVSDKWIHSFNSRNMILLRGNLGLTAIHDINLLPLSLNFFTGGSQSVRGYGYNNLGPGRYLVVSSVEYRYRVYKKWYATTFFDIGNAFNNWPTAPHSGIQSNLGALNHRLNQGAGVGVVWSSPLGAMELTYAKEVNVSGMPGRIQFNLGTDL